VQERQFPPSDSDQLVPAEREALRRVRGRRLQGLGAAAGGALLVLLASGCPEPADLQNAQLYDKPGFSSSGGSGGAAGPSCEVACVNDIFQTQPTLCKLCHGPALKSSKLDLAAPGYTARLKNVPAVHGDLPKDKATCTGGDKLIDTTTPANSWLLKKIEGTQGTCGDAMPNSGMLTPDQKKCLETYVACVAGGPIGGGTAGSTSGGAAGSASGGTAGAATGGGGAATGGGGSGGKAGSGGSGGA
jgi:hypothetical protein